MPPWSSRLLPTANTAPSTSSTSASGTGTQRPIHRTDGGRHNHTNEHSQTRSPPSSQTLRRVPTHGRSVSHPFPSLFGAGRRGERTNEHVIQTGPPNGEEGAEHISSRRLQRSPSREIQSTFEEEDFVTGNCATCDSTVRWPSRLKVYRCTVCLMVNDLELLAKASVKDHGTGPASTSAQKAQEPLPTPHIQRKAPTLSIERTRNLIDQSIKAFLEQRARHLSRKHALAVSGPTVRVGNDSVQSSSHETPIVSSRQRPVPDQHVGSQTNGGHMRTHDTEIEEGTGLLSTGPPDRAPPSPPKETESKARQDTKADTDDGKQDPKFIFRQVEVYIVACLNDCECLNATFGTARPSQPTRASSEASAVVERPQKPESIDVADSPLFEVDAKTLLLGDIGENGTWWTGGRRASERRTHRDFNASVVNERRAPRFDWYSVQQWYSSIISCGMSWKSHRQRLSSEERYLLETQDDEAYVEGQLADARHHVQRTFLKAIENLLRRPGKPLKTPLDCRFLLILMLNPLLYQHEGRTIRSIEIESQALLQSQGYDTVRDEHAPNNTQTTKGGATGQHSGVIKRLLGLMANLPIECHQSIVSWMCRLPEPQFKDMVELVGGFVTYRLTRQNNHSRKDSHDPIGGLIPSISGLGAGTSAHLHAALSSNRRATSSKATQDKPIVYTDDWQIRMAARVMSLLFSANSSMKHPYHSSCKPTADAISSSSNMAARHRAQRHSQILPTSAFYNTLLDYADLVADFERWEARRGKFSFCQYPMFLSIWAKIRIMEHDAHRQMEIKAREAFFTSIMSRKAVNQYLILKVRRDCLVDDSLRSVSEVVGTGEEEIKKGLRIEFIGEEGVDAGGLRKEWFLLLVREVFDPDHGLFVYDEESQYCYFNPNSFETSDQFFLVGVVLGLAIYNSTILDVALPPFAFRKLLASAPSYTGPATKTTRISSVFSLDDLAEWRPTLAKGLRQLLDHEGDVETTFCRDFVVDVERYGQIVQIPLCPNGESRAVTNSNRREFVELYIRYLLDTSVARQYEPFKRGFFTVCGGNALSLFRPEEIELLIRGSDEPLDIASLRAVAVYENWPSQSSTKFVKEPLVVQWFWDYLAQTDPATQKLILTFITGSDRIPAMGTTSLVIKVVFLTEDYHRYPVARTCFNMIGLHQYRSSEELESRLWRAVQDSEGFGLK